ncbi:MAG TPA: IS1595 family transposase [Candidatus Sulfotelmatobacter sp.]|jgi:transposase-like protein
MANASEPKTLQSAIQYFGDPDNCLSYLIARRWKDGVVCPTCDSKNVSFVASRRVWQCKTRHPKSQFSIKVGTIFEDSPIGLDKWLTAMWMIANCKNGVSSWEVSRSLGVTQKSAWFMLQRIRFAMQGKNAGKLGGPGSEVEVDETFIGGKARNMHRSKRARVITGTGGKDKTVVMGMLERGGNVRAVVVDNRRRSELHKQVRENVEAGAALYSDELKSYDGLSVEYEHAVINHAVEYVNGNIHTNGMENFWSLLKRGLHGTYVSVEPFHLFRYIDEQAFRYNNRKNMSDADRFDLAVSQIVGKRLTYAEVTGKVGATDF